MKKTTYPFEGMDLTQKEIWENDEGVIHRDCDLPAITVYYPNGKVKFKEWYIEGKHKRRCESDPDCIGFFMNEKLKLTQNRHLFKGYTYEEVFYENGRIKKRSFYQNGKFHNNIGFPAYSEWTEKGDIVEIKYYSKGMDISSKILEFCLSNNIPFGSYEEDSVTLLKLNWNKFE